MRLAPPSGGVVPIPTFTSEMIELVFRVELKLALVAWRPVAVTAFEAYKLPTT